MTAPKSAIPLRLSTRLLVPLLGLMLLAACGRDETAALSDRLNYMLENKAHFAAEREARIDELRRLLKVANLSPQQEYAIDAQLCDEYAKYQLDSAIRYVERNIAIARQLRDARRGGESRLRLAGLYSSKGMCIEAEELLRSLPRATLPDDLLPLYYITYKRFYQQYMAFSGQRKYQEQARAYQDSLLLTADTTSLRYRQELNNKRCRQDLSADAERELLHFLATLEPGSQPYAEMTNLLGNFYKRRQEVDLARKYFMLSAIADIGNATKENVSLLSLAMLCYDEGKLAQAFRLAQSAVEDALFCNVPFRTLQMSEFYSHIIASHQAQEARSKSTLQGYLALIGLLSAVLVLLFAYAYRQVRRLSRTKEALSQTNVKLAQLNDELNCVNERLTDANAVKVQYIGRFFDLCSLYIDKMDDYRKTLKKLSEERRFEELYRRLKSTSMLENEHEALYRNFDEIFLNLYPTFVEEFNALLCEDERIVLKSSSRLNRELRIYALVRLGITNSAKIASFLRCSLSTVYNYRTRMRNRAAAGRDDFEQRVMRIGIIGKTAD